MTQHGGEEYLTSEEASAVLGVARRTLERYARDNRIHRYKRGIRILFKREDVERLKEELDQPQLDIPEGE